ncbi:MAG: preprotein translocase subunit YajC [candidate division Zixibacteria bacterium RBG_16_53_22]|nr:MAG: preprotein translocase subunit YajC [candidate division Zixibacteria bacterium RBG_16_53_22]
MGTSPGGSPGGGGGGFMSLILMFAMIFAIMYFFMIRPQQKREKDRQKMLVELKKGDKVVTNSGMVGTIWGIKDNIIVLKFEEDVKIEFLKSAIAGKMD